MSDKERLFFALDLLRGNVIRRPLGHGGRFRFRIHPAGQAEVHQLGFVVRVEQDVAWLDVAMERLCFSTMSRAEAIL